MPREKKVKRVGKKTAAKKVISKTKKETLKVVKKQSGNASFFQDLIAETGNELAQAASNGIISGDISGWIDTGVFLLNAQYSGSLWGGVPDNKIIVFAGPAGVGKTYFILEIVKDFLKKDPEAGIVFFESESAITKQMLIDRGVDVNRVFIVPVSTVQEWKTQSLKVLAKFKESAESKRRPMMMVLDSLGMLSTTKEMDDSTEGKETKDMTRAGHIKATFRTLTLKLGVLKVPLLITNHTYDTQGLYSTKVQGGGTGVQYANSMTVFLGKSKDKDGDEVVGTIIRSVLNKGRLTKENTKVEARLNYTKGLDRYYGLLDFAVEHGVVKKAEDAKGKPIKGEFVIGGVQATEKQIDRHPEQYFTQEVLEQIEVEVGKVFKYGTHIEVPLDDVEEEGVDVPSEETTNEGE